MSVQIIDRVIARAVQADIAQRHRVQRSGMSSDAGLSVDRTLIAHRQGLKRGAATSTVPNNEFNRHFSTDAYFDCRTLSGHLSMRLRSRCNSALSILTPWNFQLTSVR
jgi:hypothetical protein